MYCLKSQGINLSDVKEVVYYEKPLLTFERLSETYLGTAPRILYYPYRSWMALGHVLGWVNSHIILGLVFIFILQPIAYIMRLTGYDPLRNKRRGEKTYRENRKDNQIDLTRTF